ncbi:MAG: hemolysin III family protein [Paludibacteraceae bacterium]|nr:hemolysin III family protein [Paludibacteraceae bacterium]MBR6043651.1 hemolysin III family protein [Paludibacteraceae bacterium]
MSYAITHEEVANSATHFLGVLLAPVMLFLLLYLVPSHTWQSQFSVIVFCLGVLVLYSSSTVYHFVLPSHAKKVMRYFDHINIYVLIAASYTPIFICGLGGTLGWVMFGVEWLLVIAGGIFKVCCLGQHPKLSLFLYMLMGWSFLIVVGPFWHSLSTQTLSIFVAEGLLYTLGSYFFVKDDAHRYFHAIWHVFVLAGTVFHFFLILSLFH